MIATDFTRLVGCAAPLQLAGMGGMATPPLIAAVANAGGLGMLGAAMMRPDVLGAVLDELREATPAGKVGVNFLMPFLQPECVDVAADKADVVEFFYDDPDGDLIQRVHAGGALACWQVGSPAEARAAIDAGCDMIVAQGVEAGGHVRGTLPLFVLLDRVLDFAEVPVLAAGGTPTGSGLAAALAAGAAGVRIGTRFLAATESVAHPHYVDALLQAGSDDTVLTTAFSDGWPDAPHRVLESCVAAAGAHDGPIVGTAVLGGRTAQIPRFNVVPPDASASGDIAAMCLYAGQSVEAVARREPAADIVHGILGDAQRSLQAAAATLTQE